MPLPIFPQSSPLSSSFIVIGIAFYRYVICSPPIYRYYCLRNPVLGGGVASDCGTRGLYLPCFKCIWELSCLLYTKIMIKLLAAFSCVKSSTMLFSYLQPPPPTLPMYRSQCWCISRASPTDKSAMCIPPVYVVGVSKCGTVDLVKGIWRHPLVEKADTMEQISFSGNLQYVKKPVPEDCKSKSICDIYAWRGRLCPSGGRTAQKLYLTHWGRVTHIYASVKQPSLFQIMACRLVGAKPLSSPMLEYC